MQPGPNGEARDRASLDRLRRFLAEQGYHPGQRDERDRALPRDACLHGDDSARQMTLRPLRFSWSHSGFAGSWWIACGVLVSRNSAREFEAREWRAAMDGLDRDDGDNSTDAQVDFFIQRLRGMEAWVRPAPVQAVQALQDARVRLNTAWPKELHQLREWLLARGYRMRPGAAKRASGMYTRAVFEGPVLAFEVEQDRGYWSVSAARAGIGAAMLPAEAWRAWMEHRKPRWRDEGLGFHPYVADALFFRTNHDLMEAAVKTPQPAVSQLDSLAFGPWEGEPEWRTGWRRHADSSATNDAGDRAGPEN